MDKNHSLNNEIIKIDIGDTQKKLDSPKIEKFSESKQDLEEAMSKKCDENFDEFLEIYAFIPGLHQIIAIEKIKKLVKKNEYDQVVIKLREFLKKYPENYEALEFLGTSLVKKKDSTIKDFKEAELHFKKSLEIKPDNKNCLYLSSLNLLLLQRFDELEVRLNKAFQIFNDDVFFIGLLGVAKILLNKEKEAKELLSKSSDAKKIAIESLHSLMLNEKFPKKELIKKALEDF